MGTFKFDEIAFNSTEKKKPVDEDKYTYLGLEHLDPDSIYVTRYGADVAPKGDKLVMKKGDVLFGKRRAYQKKVAIAPFDGIFSAHGMVLRPKEDVIDKNFFPMFIKSDYFLDAAIKISVGSLSPTINWRDLKELKFELPSLEEQRKLADVLWAIYDMKDKYKKLISATDELVKSQFIEMFGKEEKSVPLKECGIIVTGGTPSKKKQEYYKSKDIHFYKPNDCPEDHVKYLSESEEYISEEARSVADVFKPGTILVTCIGTIGKIGILTEEGTCNQQINAIIPDGRCISEYVANAIWVKKHELEQKSNATTVTIINKTSFSEFEIPMPSLDKQRQFVDFVQQSDKSKFYG